MQSYFLKRMVLLLITLWGITLVSFVILQLAPGSPIEMKLQQDQSGSMSTKSVITDEARKQLEKQYHLDQPILTRYILWVKDLATFNLGTSFTDHRLVSDKILECIPVSLIFGISSIIVAILIGIPLGLISAAWKNSKTDRGIMIFLIVLYSLPVYVFGILLITFFGSPSFFDWFPVYGIQSDAYSSLSLGGKMLDRTYHFILPCLCYAIGSLAFISQQQRASLLDVLEQDFVRTARAKGLSERAVVLKHAFRNSLIPIVTIMGGLIPAILGGSVIIEKIFSIPGLGLLILDSLLQRDYPTIMANFTISAFLSLLGIFFADLFYVLADPRIDFEGRS